ncbi:MAG: hypothetical protein ABI054_01310 [Planctomycetota bacterium]
MRIPPRVSTVRHRGAARVELLLALLLFVFAGWYGSCRIGAERNAVADDAYITYTYGRNLAEGHGLRFNASDPQPTSGCSTELHLLYSAGAIALGLDPLVATRALSLACVLALGVLFGLVGARVIRTSASRGLLVGAGAAWGLMIFPETGVHLTSGMETLLFTFIHALAFAWAVWVCARVRPPGILVAVLGAVLLTALVLTRPEGWILALLYTAAVIVGRIPRGGLAASLRECSGLAVVALLVVVGLFAWRYATFGSLLGNPYYVKSANAIFGSDGSLFPGIEETLRFALLRLAPAMLVLGLSAAGMAFEARVWIPALALLAPSMLVLGLYTHAIHEMAGGSRYEYPLIVPWIGAGVGAMLALSLRSRQMFRAILASAVFVVPALASPIRPDLWEFAQHARSSAIAWIDRRVPENALSRAGRDLGATGLGQRATILLSAAGQIPWYSNFTSVDWIGLNDTRLSGRSALTIEQVWQYIGLRNPDLVQSILPPAAALDTTAGSDPNFQSAIVQATLRGRGSGLFEHWNHERFVQMVFSEMHWVREHCVLGACYKLGDAWGDDWWVFLYVRKDSPHREALLQVLRDSKRADRTSDLSSLFDFDPRQLKD